MDREHLLKYLGMISGWLKKDSPVQKAVLDVATAALYAALEEEKKDPKWEIEELAKSRLLSEWLSLQIVASLERVEEMREEYVKKVGEFPERERLLELAKRRVLTALSEELVDFELPF